MSQKKIKKVFKLTLCAALLIGTTSVFSNQSFAQDNSQLEAPKELDIPVRTVKSDDFDDKIVTHPPLRLTPDKSEIIRLKKNVGSIILGNPRHLNILPDSSNTLIAVPRAQGASFFTILDENGDIIMQRHVIVGSAKEKYVRIRRSCGGSNDCQPTSVYYCPDMCHEIQTSDEESGSGNSLADALAEVIGGGENNQDTQNNAPSPEDEVENQ